jgi:hypothetical protein
MSRREAELATAVMHYLRDHPQAMDSAQGIAEWWVKPQRAGLDMDTVPTSSCT